MQDNWTPNQLKLIEYLATPRMKRTPPTLELLAKNLGVNASTLYRWKNIDGFQAAVNQLARQSLGKALPDIYGALIREAEGGSYQHQVLLLELTGEYTKTTRSELTGKDGAPLALKGYVTVSPDDWDEDADSSD